MSTRSTHACGPQCALPAEAQELRTAVAERLAAASTGFESQSYAMTAHDALGIVGSRDGVDASDTSAEHGEPWWKRVVLAECLAAHLLPTRFAAFAAHRELAPSVGAVVNAPQRAVRGAAPNRLIACPASMQGAETLTVTAVPGGELVDGRVGEYPLGGPGEHLYLIPISRSGPREAVIRCVVADPGADMPAVRAIRTGAHTAALELSSLFVPCDARTTISADAVSLVALQTAAYCVAAAQLLIRDTRQYCASRSSLGGLLWNQQAVRFRLADAAARADGTRELVRCAARRLAEGYCDGQTLCAAAFTATALLNDISALSLHLRGAAGHVNVSAARHLLIDSRTLTAVSRVRPCTRRAFATAGSASD